MDDSFTKKKITASPLPQRNSGKRPAVRSADDKAVTENRNEAVYGGFQYRMCYDEYQKSLTRRKNGRGGIHTFALIAALSCVACFAVFGGFLVFGSLSGATLATMLIPGGQSRAGSEASDMLVAITGTYDGSADSVLSVSEISEIVTPSVVKITVGDDINCVSGIILNRAGYIATDYTSVRYGKSVTVTLSDGTERDCEVIGVDSLSDIAVIRIKGDTSSLTPAVIGSCSKLSEDDAALIFGFGSDGVSYCSGVISDMSRDISIADDNGTIIKTMAMIETSADISRLSLGGPLVNSRGEVIGITAMEIRSGSRKLGLAISAADAVPIINELITHGEVIDRPANSFAKERLRLGITCRTIDQATADMYRLPVGVFVELIEPDSTLHTAGLSAGDIIVSINGSAVASTTDLNDIIDKLQIGDTISIEFYREGMYYDITYEIDR